MAYIDTDTIWYVRLGSQAIWANSASFQEDHPRALVRMQHEHWDPLFAWMKQEYGIDLVLADGFAPAKQTTQTKEKMNAVLQQMDQWELAGELVILTASRKQYADSLSV